MDLKLALLAVDARQLDEEPSGGCEAGAGRRIRQRRRNNIILGRNYSLLSTAGREVIWVAGQLKLLPQFG